MGYDIEDAMMRDLYKDINKIRRKQNLRPINYATKQVEDVDDDYLFPVKSKKKSAKEWDDEFPAKSKKKNTKEWDDEFPVKSKKKNTKEWDDEFPAKSRGGSHDKKKLFHDEEWDAWADAIVDDIDNNRFTRHRRIREGKPRSY